MTSRRGREKPQSSVLLRRICTRFSCSFSFAASSLLLCLSSPLPSFQELLKREVPSFFMSSLRRATLPLIMSAMSWKLSSRYSSWFVARYGRRVLAFSSGRTRLLLDRRLLILAFLWDLAPACSSCTAAATASGSSVPKSTPSGIAEADNLRIFRADPLASSSPSPFDFFLIVAPAFGDVWTRALRGCTFEALPREVAEP